MRFLIRRKGVRAVALRFTRAALSAAAVVVMLSLAAPAGAAAPPTAPLQIRTIGFETATDTVTSLIADPGAVPTPTAYWGRVSAARQAGAWGLWCAGTAYPSGASRTYAAYPDYTRGQAILSLPELADYYSSDLSFWILQGSLEPLEANNDATQFYWYTSDPNVTAPQPRATFAIGGWTQRTFALSSDPTVPLSRKGGTAVWRFFDSMEGGAAPPPAYGPVIDSVAVTGFKYGPVRSLSATGGASGVGLSWATPWRSQAATSPEERTVAYRVWRTPSSVASWTELTSSRTSSASYVDTTAVPGQTYQYAVQTWDTGTGAGYGQIATVTAASLPDTSAPTVVTNAQPSYIDTATIAVSAFDTGSGVVSVSWRTDGTATQTVAGSTATVTVLGYGPHSISVWATDGSDNVSVPQALAFTIADAIPPSVSATVSASYANTATIVMTAADTPLGSGAHSIEYRFDNASTQTVAGSVATATTTAFGARTIRYRARDNAGNWSTVTNKAFSVTDSIPPAVTSDAVASYSDTATVALTATDTGSGVASVSWRIDGGATQTVAAATATVTVTGYGAHTLSYWAADNAGSAATPKQSAFTVADSIVPTVTASVLASYPDTATILIGAADAGTGSGVHSIEYRFDNATTVTVAGVAATATTTSFGSRSIRYRARDVAGNWSSVVTKAFLVTDATPPVVASDAIASYADTATIKLTATDAGSGVASVSWRVDGGATQSVGAAAATVTVTGPGEHELEFWATDVSGNTAPARVAGFGIADGAAPSLGVVALSGENTVTVSIAATDTVSGIKWLSYALDGGTVTTLTVEPSVTSTAVAVAVGPGAVPARSVTAWATDASGLVSSATASFRVTDTIVPTIQNNAVASYVGTATVTLTAADTGSGIKQIGYRFGSAATQTVAAATVTATTTAIGQVRLNYVAEDLHGNTTSGGVTVTVTPAVSPVTTVGRISGSDRYAVAVGIARAGWPTPSAVADVIIANGETGKEADPLAAAGLAGAYDAPVVLTQAARLPTATRSYLTQVAAARKAAGKTLNVHIVGGPVSVPDARWNEIRAIPGVSATKDRLSGADRYAVTVTIANRIVSRKGVGAVNGVLIINAQNPAAFYDALAASPIAFSRTMPMLGVKSGSVPASVGKALASGPLATKTNRYVVSSPTFVSAGVYSQVKASKRLATKADRYAAAAEISTQGLALGMGTTSVGVASALPDALTGGALFGKKGGVMLFTTSKVLSVPTKSWLSANKAGVRSVTVLGGTASVSDSVKTSIGAALK